MTKKISLTGEHLEALDGAIVLCESEMIRRFNDPVRFKTLENRREKLAEVLQYLENIIEQ